MQKIITCIDGSVFAEDVCNAGRWAAKRLERPILFLHTLQKERPLDSLDYAGASGISEREALLDEVMQLEAKRHKLVLQLATGMLKDAEAKAQEQGCGSVHRSVRDGAFVDVMEQIEPEAHLLVVGRSGETYDKSFRSLGAHIEQVMRRVQKPLLIANRGFTAPQSFMLAYDGRKTSDDMVERVVADGLLQGLDCHLVTVRSIRPQQQEKFKAAEGRLQAAGFRVTAAFLEGGIFDALVAYQQHNQVDMLVMGAFGGSKIRQVFMGSNTMKVVENTDLPLLIVR